ncbi:hypothetical protein [Kitasatospora sp. NPDC088548]|uniref:hypothetical protein n=1 Tax=Kitasatospora sp. NPDC088548 TaxID=3364075 RepID=UPI003817BE35
MTDDGLEDYRSAAEQARLNTYSQGDTFISTLLETGGHPLIERLLKNEDLLPTLSEITNPTSWLKRYAPAMNGV